MDRNFIIAIVLSAGVLIGWEVFVAGPQRAEFEAARQEAASQAAAESNEPETAALSELAPDLNVGIDEALAAAPGRIEVDTPFIHGSINLAGGRIDDLTLKRYRETLDAASPEIRLLSPGQTEHGHYIQQGWFVGRQSNERAVWSAPDATARSEAWVDARGAPGG